MCQPYPSNHAGNVLHITMLFGLIELLPLFFLGFSWFGILNTSISGEMSQHLMSVPSKYVPQLKKDSGNVVLDRVFVDGDQLTEQSAHNENVLVMFNRFLGW